MDKIKICVGMDEYNKIKYYRDFSIVTELPASGEEYEGNTVVSIEEVRKDPEQPTTKAEEYDCYKIITKNEEGEEEIKYAAISSQERNHMADLIIFDGVLPPTATELNLLIANTWERSQQLKEDMIACDEDNILEDYFGIRNEEYEKAVVEGSGYCNVMPDKPVVKNTHIAMVESAELICSMSGVILRGMVPYWWEEEPLVITHTDAEEMIERGSLPERGIADLHPDVFQAIVNGYEEIGESYLEEEGYPGYFDLISLNPREIVQICQQIEKIVLAPFKELIGMMGYTQATFCRQFNISRRTVEDWSMGKSACKTHIRLMLAELTGLITRRHLEKDKS